MNEIYDFSQGVTANYLRQKYIKTFKLDSRFEIEVGTGVYNSSTCTRSSEGFFNIDPKGEYSRQFAFLSSYKVMEYGMPVMHLVDCQTMKKYMGFSLSTANTVDIICRNSGYLHENIKLKVCKNCLEEMGRYMSKSILNKSFEDFILDLEDSTKTRETNTTIDGYTMNWPQISTAYRSAKEFRCEKCGIQISEKGERHFMQTHHLDYDKKNNSRSNLQCLCILCHANVDERHKHNFSKPGNIALLGEFKSNYSSELRRIRNPFF